jgi:hypothetical protein
MSVAEFASQVKANPDRYSDLTVKQANLARTLRRMSR